MAVGATTVVTGLGLLVLHAHPEVLGRRSGGPLACQTGKCGRSGTGVPVHVGGSASIGPIALRNEGEATLTLERIELLDVDPGLEVIDVVLIEPDGRHPPVGARQGFPPPHLGPTHAVHGFELAPAVSNSDFVQVLFGLRLRTAGRAGSRRIAVDYRVGRKPYRAYFDDAMWLCTWALSRRGECIDPDG